MDTEKKLVVGDRVSLKPYNDVEMVVTLCEGNKATCVGRSGAGLFSIETDISLLESYRAEIAKTAVTGRR